MKILVSLIFILTISKALAQRRQFMSYASNVIHENHNYPDQAAQSSVQFNLNTNPTEVKKIYPQEVYNPQAYNTQNYVKAPSDSQLFNVGYSVSFTNGNKPSKNIPKYPRKVNLDNGEIITGTRKQNEEVDVPQEFSYSTKKQKIGGIKPQKGNFGSFPNPKVLLSQANLSPNTQKFYRALEQTKSQIQNPQELQNYNWRNLSPGVEIIRSTEVPIPKVHKQEFGHGRALGRSQEFDFSNAVDGSNQPTNVFYNNVKANYPQIDTTLLKEPVHVDTRLLKEAQSQEIPYQAKFQEQPQNIEYLQQAYRTLPVETKPVHQVFYHPEQHPNFQNFEPERPQLKIYGKPFPVFTPDDQFKRQPRYVHDLHRNLRPPPFDLPYQRLIRVA